MFLNLSDSLQLASKLTSEKVMNAYRVYAAYQKARRTGHAVMSGLPISLTIEPTTSCNLRCPECPSGLRSFTRPTGMLDTALAQKAIDELSESLIYMIFYFQGEPYLHPELLNMVQYASSRGIYTATSTNAHYITEEIAQQTIDSGLDRMIISIDGATQETYASYRKGGKLEKVLEATKRMVHWKREKRSRTPHLVWQFLVVKPNEHEVSEVRRMARNIGVDKVAFKTAQIYDYEDGNSLIPTIDKYSRYSQKPDGRYQLKNKLRDECWKMWHSSVMTWDGRIVPCCFDKDAHHVMGSTTKDTFTKIWHSASYNAFRRTLFTSRDQLDMCKNCSEGTKVWS